MSFLSNLTLCVVFISKAEQRGRKEKKKVKVPPLSSSVNSSKSVKMENYQDVIDIASDGDEKEPWLTAADNRDSCCKSPTGKPKKLTHDGSAATLIVCPLSVLSNWTVRLDII